MLARPAGDISAGEILRAAEGSTAAVACDKSTCGRADLCSTVKFWTGLEAAIDAYVDGVSLADLAHVPELDIHIDASAFGGAGDPGADT